MQDGKIVQSKTDSTRRTNDAQPTESNTQTTRRVFLKTAGIGAAALNANALIPGGLVQNAAAVEISPFVRHPQQRANDLRELRRELGRAAADALVASEPHPTNGDEETSHARISKAISPRLFPWTLTAWSTLTITASFSPLVQQAHKQHSTLYRQAAQQRCLAR